MEPDGKHLLASCGRHLQVWDAGDHAIEDSVTIDVQGEDLVAWHLNVARSCVQDRNWYGAKFHWDRLISLEPDKLNYWSGRANANAQLGKLDSAIQDYQTAFELDGERFSFLIRTSLLQLALGEIGNHKKTKQQLLGSFADDVPESGKNQLAWAATISRGSKAEAEQVLKLAEAAVAHSRSPAELNTLALALHRTEKFEESIERATEAMELRLPRADISDCLILAMSHSELGNDSEAIRWFDKSAWQIEERLSTNARTPIVWWTQRLELKILLDEAAAAIKKLQARSNANDSSWLNLAPVDRKRAAWLSNEAGNGELNHDWPMAAEMLESLVPLRPDEKKIARRLAAARNQIKKEFESTVSD